MVKLVKTRRGCAMLERHDRYDVVLNGKVVDQLYFNLVGYTGYIPFPDGNMPVCDASMTLVKRYVASANREWKKAAVTA